MRLEEKIIADKMFILSATSIELYSLVTNKYPEYLEQFGYQHFYDTCVDIVNEVVDNDLNYKKYLTDKNTFSNLSHGLDTYFSEKAFSMFTAERIAKIAGGEGFLRVAFYVLKK
jgi:hypothetical protein